MSRYRVKDMGRGFDGLTVEGHFIAMDFDGAVAPGDALMVTKITNDHVVFGDRNVSFPVPREALYIHENFLERLEDEQREYSAEYPFGVEMFTYRLTKDRLEVVLTQYEGALSVTVLEKTVSAPGSRTLYSQNYIKFLDLTRNKIHDLFTTHDIEDLVFELKALKTAEK